MAKNKLEVTISKAMYPELDRPWSLTVGRFKTLEEAQKIQRSIKALLDELANSSGLKNTDMPKEK